MEPYVSRVVMVTRLRGRGEGGGVGVGWVARNAWEGGVQQRAGIGTVGRTVLEFAPIMLRNHPQPPPQPLTYPPTPLSQLTWIFPFRKHPLPSQTCSHPNLPTRHPTHPLVHVVHDVEVYPIQ